MKNWFITGVSRGLGSALAKAALARGDNVFGTVRSEVPDVPHRKGQLHIIKIDVSDESGILVAVEQAFSTFGRIDVVVNNAGYGVMGAVETSTDEELQKLFAVDVFAPIRISRASLPYLRKQRSGHIMNITSIAGRAPGVGSALYAAAKFAMEGFSAALSQEVAPFGIHLTAIAPGQFRTDFFSKNSVHWSASDASASSSTLTAALDALSRIHQTQPGDPDLAAKVIVEAAYAKKPPVHLLLGKDALKRVRAQLDVLSAEINDWEAATSSTDFAKPS